MLGQARSRRQRPQLHTGEELREPRSLRGKFSPTSALPTCPSLRRGSARLAPSCQRVSGPRRHRLVLSRPLSQPSHSLTELTTVPLLCGGAFQDPQCMPEAEVGPRLHHARPSTYAPRMRCDGWPGTERWAAMTTRRSGNKAPLGTVPAFPGDSSAHAEVPLGPHLP